MNNLAVNRWTCRILIGLAFVTPILVLTALPWLKAQADWLAVLVAGAASVIVVASSMILSILKDQQADEWTRTGARFSGHWGFVSGAAFFALLLALPPFQQFVVELATNFQGAPVDKKLVMLTFTSGFMVCVFLQMIFVLIIGAAWRIWMSRAA